MKNDISCQQMFIVFSYFYFSLDLLLAFILLKQHLHPNLNFQIVPNSFDQNLFSFVRFHLPRSIILIFLNQLFSVFPSSFLHQSFALIILVQIITCLLLLFHLLLIFLLDRFLFDYLLSFLYDLY